jgi:para-aminobenzoate synthetase/4-amino-4-deoxychorismate lyase
LVGRQIEEVLPALRSVENAVTAEGLYGAGFVSYEAAPAFDASLPARADGEFPLLWFGLFEQPEVLDHLPTDGSESTPAFQWRTTLTQEEYRDALRSVREYIRNGDTYQVNFTYRLRTSIPIDPWALFTRLMADHETPYAAFVDTGEWVVCSTSPELFFRLDGDHIESRPMKGTAARGLWYADDCRRATELTMSEKDRAENVMIVDMVRNDLGRVAETGSVHVPDLFAVERYPTVWQMTSRVCAKTQVPLDRIFQALFPPASITGAPKRRTMEIIAELESSPRRIYTGAIGMVTPARRAQFNVAIRTLLIHRKSNLAEYGVGGGIVWDSQQDKEWEECSLKTRVLHVRRPSFDLLETMLWSPKDGFSLLEYHLKRLAQSAAYFGFCVDPLRIREELEDVASRLGTVPHRIRLLVSRTGASKCEASPTESGSAGFADIVLARSPVDSSDVFLYHKTTHRRVYDDALKACPGFADVLLFNEKGEITESTIANVVVESDGGLWTPPVHCGLLPGTYRAWLLDRKQVQEKTISIDEILQSPKVYLANSVRGMHGVKVVCSEEQPTGSLLRSSKR